MTTKSTAQPQRIRDRLAGHHILVTGATGFLARAFVEKMLRSVDSIGGIHLLVRSRSGRSSAARRVERDVLGSSAFNRLRASLVERPGLRFVGESIVLQSDFLFASSSADMREGANAPLTTLARTLLSASRDAPIGLEWVLRVDGHTDSRPLEEDGPFESNLALSAERARQIVQYLAGQGVSPERLAAVGFGEYRPVDPSGDEIAFRRNRRVEFHLVAR